MIINMGAKIKQLRKEKGISQEILAEALGVSFQAVSKWETETTLPDVALVPAIASFFEVSTDDLFDYNRLEADKKVMEICQASWEVRDSHPERAEEILRAGLRQFPGNDIILNNLLYVMNAPERRSEVITLCQTLIETTRDDEVRLDALRILAETYHAQGEKRLCAQTLERLPEIYFTKLEHVAELMEGEESYSAACAQMGISAAQTVAMLLIMRDRLIEKNQPDDAGKYARIARGICELFAREEGENFHSERYRSLLETLETFQNA